MNTNKFYIVTFGENGFGSSVEGLYTTLDKAIGAALKFAATSYGCYEIIFDKRNSKCDRAPLVYEMESGCDFILVSEFEAQ